MTATGPRSIVLVGLMLSGKSTVGAALAGRLAWPFTDLDDVIVARTGQTIAEWFARGEAAFRRAERDLLAAVLAESGPRVIATGGGAMQDARSRRRCRQTGFVVYLEATPAELAARLTGPSGRPLLDDAADPAAVLTRLLDERRDNYLAVGHLRVAANEALNVLVERIIDAYGEHIAH